MKTIFLLLSLSAVSQLFCAEQAPKRSSDSMPNYYEKIGVDDFDTNLVQLQEDQRAIRNGKDREDFIKLCEAAIKVFSPDRRVSEIEQLKQEVMKRS